jgi:hypothetical protein
MMVTGCGPKPGNEMQGILNQSKTIAKTVDKSGFFEQKIEFNGYIIFASPYSLTTADFKKAIGPALAETIRKSVRDDEDWYIICVKDREKVEFSKLAGVFSFNGFIIKHVKDGDIVRGQIKAQVLESLNIVRLLRIDGHG